MRSPLAAPAKTKSSDVSRLHSWKPVWIPKKNCSPDFKYVHIYLYIKMSEQECGLVRCSTPPLPAWICAALMGSDRQPTKRAAPFAPAPPANLTRHLLHLIPISCTVPLPPIQRPTHAAALTFDPTRVPERRPERWHDRRPCGF